ncbi:MAG: hypothetical protein HYZ14_14300 [Bacteroidetes bacterium]|nr:hypothetical protein [Bacteroidota bacterium]
MMLKFAVKGFFFFSLSGFLMVSCAGQATPVTDTTDSTAQSPRDTVNATWSALQGDSLKPGTVILIEGFVGDIGNYVAQSNGKMTFPLFPRRNQRSAFRLNLRTQMGEQPNQVHELPAEFSPEDFKLVLNDKSFATRGSYVRVTAILSETGADGGVYADLTKIESCETVPWNPLLAGAVPLTADMIHDSTLAFAYCFIEGELELPEIILPYTHEIVLNLKGSSVAEITTVEIPLGTGPGTMNDLPDNYTEADLVIRDYQSTPVKYGKKVRIYGLWERNTFESGFPGKFYVEELETLP